MELYGVVNIMLQLHIYLYDISISQRRGPVFHVDLWELFSKGNRVTSSIIRAFIHTFY